MRSLPPAEFEVLPRLARPAAYICVIRDVDRNRYRLQATARPAALIESVMAEAERAYGLELLSVVETADIAASEARLSERHHASLGEQWLELDAYQMRELQTSELQIQAHGSHYISPRRSPKLEKAAPPRATSRKPAPVPSLFLRQYGVGALKRQRFSRAKSEIEASRKPKRMWQSLDEAIIDLWVKHPRKCLAALGLIVLFCLASVDLSCSPWSGCLDS